MNMIFSKVRVERNVQRFQEKRKNGMNAKFSAKCVALIAAGAMSMSLAACSGGSMDDSSSSNGSAANSDTITLGSVTTNSGTAAAYGEAEVAGFKLAVDEINAKGGINGKKVKLESMDDKGDATEASNAFNKLAGDNSVLGVVGPTRMDYAQITARLSYFAENLSRMFQKNQTPAIEGPENKHNDPEA